MPLKGQIWREDQSNIRFTVPEPELGSLTLSYLKIDEGVTRLLVWGPQLMIEKGRAGRAILKYAQVGTPIDVADLPETGSTGILKDRDTGVEIFVQRV